MSSARAALVLAVALSDVRTASAEPCAARAELDGDAAAVERVTAELARLGVSSGRAAPGCRGVVAQVELDREGGIAVAIRDGSRRSEGRVVSGAAMAAAWIDSWLHDDLDGTTWLLATPPAGSLRTTSDATPRSHPVVERVGVPLLERIAFTGGYEQTWSDDGASASGVSVAGCLRVGQLCVGGRARYSREGDRTVNLTGMGRSDMSLLATGSVPIAVGRMTLAPELGLGVGRASTHRIDGCKPEMPVNCDPTDPMCVMQPVSCIDANGTGKIYVGDNLAASTFTPRVAAALRIAIPLFDHVWLDGLASVTLAPFGHDQQFAGPPIDPNTGMSPGAPADQLALPGEAVGAIVLGIGLRVGVP